DPASLVIHRRIHTVPYSLSLHDALPIFMAIGRNLEESLLKGIRSLEIGNGDFHLPKLEKVDTDDLLVRIQHADDERIFVLAELRSEEHTSELQSRFDLVCRLLLEKKNDK